MNRINPYRHNCEVIRKFFAKPIFLITGIVLSIYVIIHLVLGLLIKQSLYFDFMSVASSIAFFMFYFTARSKKDFVSFRAPTVLMDVVSIIGIVFSGLITVVSGFLTVLFLLPAKPDHIEYHGSYLWSTLSKAIYNVAIIILPIITLLGVLLLLYFIGMQRITLSFKKSLSNIYLQRKGAVMFGIMSLILSVVSVIFYMGIMTIPFSGFDEYLKLFSKGINIPSLVQGLFVTLIFVLYAIIGFMYNSYIKKLVNTIETGRPVQPLPDEDEEVTKNKSALNMRAESETFNQPHQQAVVTRPVEFTPQAVFGENKAVESETKPPRVHIPVNDMQNPYMRNSAPPTKRCANCGKENPNINIFCVNCGNRL